MNDSTPQVQSEIYDAAFGLLRDLGLSDQIAYAVNSAGLILCLGCMLYFLDFLFRRILLYFVIRAVRKTKTKLDDHLLKNKVVKYFMHVITWVVAKRFLPLIFVGFPKLTHATITITDIFLIVTVGLFINAVLRSLKDWLKSKKAFEDKPLDSYAQVFTILVFFVCGILIFSLLTGKSPFAFLISLGAASAVLMLIFKTMVRQLSPTTQGLPLEFYCFTKDTRWINYEVIIADIFDH